MKYKVWFWLCLGISIVFILMTIGIHNKRVYEKTYLENLIQTQEQHQKASESECLRYDSIIATLGSYYDELFRIEFEYYKKNELSHSTHMGLGPETHSLYEDSIRILKELQMELSAETDKLLQNKQKEIDRLKEENEQILKAKTDVRHDSYFTILSGSVSILSFCFSLFCRFEDKKFRRLINDEKQDNENKPADPVSEDVDSCSIPEPKQSVEEEIEK